MYNATAEEYKLGIHIQHLVDSQPAFANSSNCSIDEPVIQPLYFIWLLKLAVWVKAILNALLDFGLYRCA